MPVKFITVDSFAFDVVCRDGSIVLIRKTTAVRYLTAMGISRQRASTFLNSLESTAISPSESQTIRDHRSGVSSDKTTDKSMGLVNLRDIVHECPDRSAKSGLERLMFAAQEGPAISPGDVAHLYEMGAKPMPSGGMETEPLPEFVRACGDRDEIRDYAIKRSEVGWKAANEARILPCLQRLASDLSRLNTIANSRYAMLVGFTLEFHQYTLTKIAMLTF